MSDAERIEILTKDRDWLLEALEKVIPYIDDNEPLATACIDGIAKISWRRNNE